MISGKYSFEGIKSRGALGIKLVLASNPSSAWIVKLPGIDKLLEFISNWLASNGLIILNIGAIFVNGKLDQNALDASLDKGIKEVQLGGLTPEREKEIDDAVIKEADRALPYTK